MNARFDLLHPLDDRGAIGTKPLRGSRRQRAKRIVVGMLRLIEPAVRIGARGDRGVQPRQLHAHRAPGVGHRLRIGTIEAKRLAVNPFPDRVRTSGDLARIVKGDELWNGQTGGTRHGCGHRFGAGIGDGFRMIGGNPHHHVASGVDPIGHAGADERLPWIANAMPREDRADRIRRHERPVFFRLPRATSVASASSRRSQNERN